MQLVTRLGVDQAPFFIVKDGGSEVVYGVGLLAADRTLR